MTIERVTYRPGGRLNRTVFLKDPVVSGPFLTGIEVDREGVIKDPSKATLKAAGAESGDIRHILDLGLVLRREAYVVDNLYGTLVPDGTATQQQTPATTEKE